MSEKTKTNCGSCENLMFMRHDTWKSGNSVIGVPGLIMRCKAFNESLLFIESNYALARVNGLISECNQYSAVRGAGSDRVAAQKK